MVLKLGSTGVEEAKRPWEKDDVVETLGGMANWLSGG